MNADNKEFYAELRKNNAETFAAWDEAFGLTGKKTSKLCLNIK